MDSPSELYAGQTYRSGNALRRLAHNSRFEVAAQLVSGEVLDYGCCDGHFSRIASDRAIFTNYEPMANNAPKNGIPYVASLDALNRQFDCIACLEVLEHLPDSQIDSFFQDVQRLLKPNGKVIISVPVMIGPVGFLKILLRHSFSGHSIPMAFRHLICILPKERPIGDGVLEHEGFDYRVLRDRIRAVFVSVDELATPIRVLPTWLNSQALFVCRGLRAQIGPHTESNCVGQ